MPIKSNELGASSFIIYAISYRLRKLHKFILKHCNLCMNMLTFSEWRCSKRQDSICSGPMFIFLKGQIRQKRSQQVAVGCNPLYLLTSRMTRHWDSERPSLVQYWHWLAEVEHTWVNYGSNVLNFVTYTGNNAYLLDLGLKTIRKCLGPMNREALTVLPYPTKRTLCRL